MSVVRFWFGMMLMATMQYGWRVVVPESEVDMDSGLCYELSWNNLKGNAQVLLMFTSRRMRSSVMVVGIRVECKSLKF